MSGLQILNRDIEYGLSQEDGVIMKLTEHFGETIQKVSDKYSPFDAESDTARYEIKCRREDLNKYSTTIIGVNKIRRTPRNKPFRLVFGFNEGLYYTEYNKERFDTYEIRPVKAVRQYGQTNYRDHYHIPISDLVPISV